MLQPASFRLKTVVIDAGHGGHDPGCSGSKSKEKHLCLAIAKYVAQALEQNYPDIKVILTRSTDVFITLNERAAIATRNKADLFISIHCNFIPKASHIHGAETYVLGLHATDENLEVAKRENASILLEENYQETYGYDPNSPEAHIVMSMFQNAFLEQSISFAQKVQLHANEEAGRRNKGVKQAGFLVLRHSTMPSVLVECGYMSNLTEEQFLRSKNGQKRMANAILLAFHDYKTEMEGSGDLAAPKKLPLDEAEEIHEPAPAERQADPVASSEKIKGKTLYVKPENRGEESKQQRTNESPNEQRAASNEQPAVVQVKQENPPTQPEPQVRKEEKYEAPPVIRERRETQSDSHRDDLLASAEPLPKNDPPRSSGKILPSVEVESAPAPPSQKPAQNVDIQYRVQLAASPKLLDVSKGAWLQVEYLLEVVEEDKLYKYQVRTFATLEEANRAKNKLRSMGFNDAFVVGYQNGKRVK